MVNDFPELLEKCEQVIKGEAVEDEWGNVTYPTTVEVLDCIPRHSISSQKEVSLGYSVDLVLYTDKELKKHNDVIYKEKKHILKRIDKKQGHYENYLVMKNV